jgi:hypothetical protein
MSGMMREHVLDVGAVLDVHHEIIASIDVVVLPEIDQVDHLHHKQARQPAKVSAISVVEVAFGLGSPGLTPS